VPRYGYRVGVETAGRWKEVANSDAAEYGGSGVGNLGGLESVPAPAHGRPHSLALTLPPLGAVFFKPEPSEQEAAPSPGARSETPARASRGARPPARKR
jgi:hypothetical protein